MLSHADGKKHRAKARAFHASKLPPKESEEPTPNTEAKSDVQKNDLPMKEEVKEPNTSDEGKKRKLEVSESNGESGNGEVIQETKKAKQNKKDGEKKIKWKKIITSVLKSVCVLNLL